LCVTLLSIIGNKEFVSDATFTGNEDEKLSIQQWYGSLIHTYADLLAQWHLFVAATVFRKSFTLWGSSSSELNLANQLNEFETSVETCCQRCGSYLSQESQSETTWCKTCAIQGVRCCICDCSLNGAAYICARCGHGGHTEELAKWFQSSAECPTGCGCRCGDLTLSGHHELAEIGVNAVIDRNSFIWDAKEIGMPY
jgi:hypothetical protein